MNRRSFFAALAGVAAWPKRSWTAWRQPQLGLAGLTDDGTVAGSLHIPDRYIYGSIEITAEMMKNPGCGVFMAAYESELAGIYQFIVEENVRLRRILEGKP